MKTLVLSLALCIGTFVQAQMSPNALGLRLDGSDGLGPEISYQRALGDVNRLELDLGLHSSRHVDAFKLTAIYQWVKPINAFPAGFYWYAGVGGGIGFIDYDDGDHPFFRDNDDYERMLVTIDGMLGMEYSFKGQGLPLQLSLDINPQIELINDYYDFFDLDVALGIRYQF